MPYFMEEKVGEVGGCVKVGKNIQLTAQDGKKQHSHQAEILEQEQMGVTNALIKCHLPIPNERDLQALAARRWIEYLGHVVSGQEVVVEDTKIKAMLDWPLPTSIKALRGFLGLTGCYHKFVNNYGSIARPLTDQLKKDNFAWSTATTDAFNSLKTAMTTIPVLALPNFTKPFVVEADASDYGLGAVLMKEGHPIAYYSLVLKPRAQLKSIYAKELMAIVLAALKWRSYLLGHHFIVRTDQPNLKFLLEQRLVTPEHQKWLVKLLGYGFDIHYQPGVGNRAADALSRVQPLDCFVLTTTTRLDWVVVEQEIKQDPLHSRVVADLEQGKEVWGFTFEKQRLLYRKRLVLAATSSLIPHFLREYHSSPIGGHSGEYRTHLRLQGDVYWVVAEAFLNHVVKLYGIPRTIVSDRDRVFLSHFWAELFRLQGTELRYSTAYHPQTDGQSEVVNRFLETYLRCLASDQSKAWAKWLSWAEYWYNTTCHSSLGCTPFKVLYGRDPQAVIRYSKGSTSVLALEQYLEERDGFLDDLKMHLLHAQHKMKAAADSSRRHVEFAVGDRVFLKLCPYRQKSLAIRKNEKLSARFYGPFTVLKRIGAVAYRLDLPTSSAVHPVFHVSQLRAVVGTAHSSPTISPTLTVDLELLVESAELLNVRQRRTPTGAPVEVLIHWKDLPLF
uniref:Integrase catalytic domain-containing protein n=1 Tax=Cannabis sativa TaxID=3483 RepID=A0A803PI17_CANSA